MSGKALRHVGLKGNALHEHWLSSQAFHPIFGAFPVLAVCPPQPSSMLASGSSFEGQSTVSISTAGQRTKTFRMPMSFYSFTVIATLLVDVK
jgi:hypothetical protein